MIYAIKHNKVDRKLYKDNEDSLTASIFERLMYLPKELFQYIIEKALFDVIPGFDMKGMESIQYWPNWNPKKTGNSKLVQPDIFIRTEYADIIIEAKRRDKKQQLRSQWKKEIKAYRNEYDEECKKLIFVALGGIHKNDSEVLTIEEKEYVIYKCTWSRILETVKSSKYRLEHSLELTHNSLALNNILTDMIMCFALYGFATADWFERFLPPQNIDENGIKTLASLWKN